MIHKKKQSISIAITIGLMVLIVACFASACQPTPEFSAVRTKSGSLINVILGDHDYESEDHIALNGQVWNEMIYQTEDISVVVDAQIFTQNVTGYPAVRVLDDTPFMNPLYLKMMISYFFDGHQPYYKTFETSKKEYEAQIIAALQMLSSGYVDEDIIGNINQRLECLYESYPTAPDDIPFDIKQDQNGEKYMRETGIQDRIALAAYPDDGLGFAAIDICYGQLFFCRQPYIDYSYQYEVGLSALDKVPQSFQMNAEEAFKIAADSVNTIAAGYDMELARIATINKATRFSGEDIDFQHLEPSCLVFYFMRSYNGVHSTYITPSAQNFTANISAEPEYSPGVSRELLRVIIDDYKIVEWMWVNPSMITSVISDNAPLMPFEQIKDIFRQQVKNRYSYLLIRRTETFNIDRIELGLMKIAEKDNMGSCLVIPVWDFIGTQEIYDSGYTEGGDADYSFLTINAIDGSVIDISIGY